MSNKSEKYSRKGLRTRYVSTVIGVSLVLFVIGLVLGGILGMENLQQQAKESLEADLYFKPEYNVSDIKQIEMQLKDWPEFSEVVFISPERALDEFSGGGQESQEIRDILDGENPLPPSIKIKPIESYATLNGMETLVAKLQNQFGEEIDEMYYDADLVTSVNLGFKQFAVVFLIVAVFLILVAVAMINNTIRLALYSKRFTIKTMQLVGAKPSFIRRPFLLQSLLQGVLSAILGMALLVTLFYALNNFLDAYTIGFDPESFLLLSGSLLVLGILITFFSTFFALNKYLRMKLDDLY